MWACTSKVMTATTSCCKVSKTVFQIQVYLFSITVVSLCPMPPVYAAGTRVWSQRMPGCLAAFSPCMWRQQQTWLVHWDLQPIKSFFLLQGNFTKGHLFLIANTGQEKSKLSLGKLEMPCKILTPGEDCACIPIFQQRSIFAVVKAASAL